MTINLIHFNSNYCSINEVFLAIKASTRVEISQIHTKHNQRYISFVLTILTNVAMRAAGVNCYLLLVKVFPVGDERFMNCFSLTCGSI